MKNIIAMKKILLMALLGIVAFACATDENSEEVNKLLGRWELQAAQRDGRPTDSLRGLYFEFSENQGFRTNIMNGEVEEGIYEMGEENSITQRNTSQDIDYTVESLTDSMLVLTTNLASTDFRFVLAKATQEETLQ